MQLCEKFCRELCKNSTTVERPIKRPTKKSVKKLIWDEQKNTAFKEIRKKIADITYRTQPNPNKEFILTTDASDFAIGAVLSQVDGNGIEEMIYTYSKAMDQAQKNYSVTEKELLAVLKSIEYFRHYLIGKPFLLRTDHKAIQYLFETKNQKSRLTRWALKLQEYTFKIQYIKGEDNFADGLSRQGNLATIRETIPKTKSNHDEISKIERKKIIQEYHYLSGHASSKTMKFLINHKYKVLKFNKEIEEFCKTCQICKKCKGPNINTKNKFIKVTAPNQIWQCDLIGRLQNSEGHTRYILVMIDHFTKWTEATILKNKSAELTIQAIKKIYH